MQTRSNIRLLTLFNFFSAFKLYSAFAAIYFSQVTHSLALGISILSITQISNAIFEIPTGFLSDKFGRKPVLFLGASARLVSLICYATGQSFFIFIIGSVLEGLASALFSGNNEALLFDSLSQIGKKEEYHNYLGKVRSMAYPSLLIASLLGGLFAAISIRLVFLLSIIPQVVCVVLTLMVIEPKHSKDDIEYTNRHFINALKTLFNNTQLRKLGLAEILTQGIEDVVFQLQLLFYNMLWPIWAVGLARSIMSLGKFISFRYSGKLINRFGVNSILLFNTLTTRLIHIIAVIFPTPVSPAAMSSTGLLWGSVETARNKLLQEHFSNNERATMYSSLSFLGSIIAGVLGILVGLVSDKFGVRNTLLLLQLLFLPIIFSYSQLHKQDVITKSIEIRRKP